jgi:hypothetical protein
LNQKNAKVASKSLNKKKKNYPLNKSLEIVMEEMQSKDFNIEDSLYSKKKLLLRKDTTLKNSFFFKSSENAKEKIDLQISP